VLLTEGALSDFKKPLYDGMELCVEVLPADVAEASCQSLSPLLSSKRFSNPVARAVSNAPVLGHPMLLYVAWFDRMRGVIGQRRELIVSTAESLCSVARRLSALPGVAGAAETYLDSAVTADRSLTSSSLGSDCVTVASSNAASDMLQSVAEEAVAQSTSLRESAGRLFGALCYFQVLGNLDIPSVTSLAKMAVVEGQVAPTYYSLVTPCWRRMADDTRSIDSESPVFSCKLLSA
jgi:hypothetical protein